VCAQNSIMDERGRCHSDEQVLMNKSYKLCAALPGGAAALRAQRPSLELLLAVSFILPKGLACRYASKGDSPQIYCTSTHTGSKAGTGSPAARNAAQLRAGLLLKLVLVLKMTMWRSIDVAFRYGDCPGRTKSFSTTAMMHYNACCASSPAPDHSPTQARHFLAM
jgi:hypothetical protein